LSHCLRPGDFRRIPRRLERDAGAAHSVDVGDQRDLGDHPRWCNAFRRPATDGLGRVGRRRRGGVGRGQRVRWVPRDAADARDVQEKRAEGRRVRQALTVARKPIMSANQVALWYLVASICFVLALKGLSHPSTARRGNVLGIVGMAIAVVVTLALVYSSTKNVAMILAGIAVGGVIGALIARRVQMTQMPELVAAFHSLVGSGARLM